MSIAGGLFDAPTEQPKVDLNRATTTGSLEVFGAIRDLFEYHPWGQSQVAQGEAVRNALASAYRTIIDNVPPCPTRTRAMNMLLDARMLANAAITFKGKN